MRTIALLLAASIVGVADSSTAQATRPAPTPTIGGLPRVSPDGASILYMSQKSGNPQIYLMRADGSAVRQLTTDIAVAAFGGEWSPDGKRIVFIHSAARVNRIAVMDADGRNVRLLSPEGDVGLGDQTPNWSPDGTKIVFAAGKFPKIGIHTMNADGSARTSLSPDPDFEYGPAWSPDGRRIAFVHMGQIWLMNADGSGRRQLTQGERGREMPAWSPDGRRIAYQGVTGSGETRDAFVEIVDVATGTIQRIGTHDKPMFDETPSWFPDGKRLAIQSKRDGAWNVYLIDLNGTVLKQLTK